MLSVQHTQLCVSRIFEILSIRMHSYFLFTARSAAAWPFVNCACDPQQSQHLISTKLCLAFLRIFVCQPIWYQILTFVKILFSSLNTMLIVDKDCSDVCCDEVSVPQIDRKCKQVKDQWQGKFYLHSVSGKLAILNTGNIKICGWIMKQARGD